MHGEIDPTIKDGIALYDEDRKIVITTRGGKYDILHNNIPIYRDLDINDAEIYGQPDVIIDQTGIIFADNSDYPYISRLSISFPDPPLRLYKATNNTEPIQTPGFMSYNREDIEQYLPGGIRHGDYGGNYPISVDIRRVERLREAYSLLTANFGSVLLIPDTPCVIDFGENDGVLVLQEINIELRKRQ